MKRIPLAPLTACLILTGIRCPIARGQNSFNVRDFGAVGDGTHLDSPAIDNAIEAAAKTGGGTVLLPAGTYLSGSNQHRNHVEQTAHRRSDMGNSRQTQEVVSLI